MMDDINDIRIIEFLANQASEEDAREILRWKNESTGNRAKFREMERAYYALEVSLNPDHYDAGAAFEKIKDELSRKQVRTRRLQLRRIAGYAAAVIVSAVFTWQAFTLSQTRTGGDLELVYNTIETPVGSKTLVKLEDGTSIWLNASSKLTYPNRFENGQRLVKLEGEAYFDVAKDKTRPFKVETAGLSINVLGTVFNVKSYPNEGQVETTLLEGEIVLNKVEKGKEENLLRLKPNQKATFIKKEGVLLIDDVYAADIPASETLQRTSEKLVVRENIDPAPVVAWTEGKMIFKKESFESIAIKLERRYNVKIRFENEVVKQYRFSGTFGEFSIEQVLKALQFASPFAYEIDNETITIKK